MNRTARWWIVRLATVALGVVVALAVAEIALRLAGPREPRLRGLLYSPTVRTHFEDLETLPELLATSTFGYHPLGSTPGFVLNSKGFRTDEYTESKPSGVYRAIALGDSFTFDSYGVPIDRMWHQVFERRLAERTGKAVEALSLSAHGVGPRFALRLWEVEGRRLEADLVILAFFVGNDFSDEAGAPLERSVDAGLARWSLTYRLLRNAARLRHREDRRQVRPAPAAEPPVRGGYELPGYAETYDANVPTFDEEAFHRIERDRLSVYAGPDRERFDRLFADTAAVVERLARQVEAAGAAPVVLIIPDQAQVDAALLARLEATGIPGPLDLDRPQSRLGTFLAARGIPHLDLLPLFRSRRGETLYKLRDTHWNLAGNRLAGTALAEFAVAHGLGPKPAAGAGDPH